MPRARWEGRIARYTGAGFMQSLLPQPDHDLPFHRDRRFLGRDTGSGIEGWVVDRYTQMGPDPSAARISNRDRLKALYQHLLPDMPDSHIASTVDDPGNISIVLAEDRTQMAGGTTYRPWAEWGFAETILKGIDGNFQGRRWAARLTARLKQFLKNWHRTVQHLLNRADKAAVEFFCTPGLTTRISLPLKLTDRGIHGDNVDAVVVGPKAGLSDHLNSIHIGQVWPL